MSTKESDFLCLLGESYMFGSEDSKFSTDNGENLYPFEEDEDQKYSIYESDFQIESELYATSESTLFEDQFSASEAPEDTRSASESKDWEEVKAGGMEQNHVPEGDHVLTSLTMSEVQGWFGLGKEQTEEAFESAIEQGSSFQSRTTAVEDENDLPELNNGEPQTEHRQESESEFGSESPEFDLGSEKQSELALESNHILKSQATGWFDGGFTSYLGFGEEDTGLELLSKESHQPLQDVPSAILSDEEATVPHTEILTEKEDIIINDSSILKPSWFDFGFGMLGFTYANEDKIASDDKKNKEDGGVDKHEHSPASEFDPDKEQEIKMMKIMETEDQTDMVSETELSMRIHEEIYQKTSPSKSNEKSTSVDSEGSAQVEADSSEGNILLNSQMVAMDGSLLSENDILQKEDATEFWILKYLFQLDVYDVMNSAFSPILILMERVVEALPEDMRSGPTPDGFPWELVTGGAIVGFFAFFLFLWRTVRSVRSRLYVGREKKLALELSELIEEKCRLLEKLRVVQKEYEGLESSLKDTSFEKESAEAQSLEFDEGSQVLEANCEELDRTKSKLEDEILFLEEQLEEEKSKHSEQDELMEDILKRIQSLEDKSESLKSQVAEAKTTLRIFQINEERLTIAIKDTVNENSQLQESQKKLLQETEVWKEKVSELNKQKMILEDSKMHAEQVLNDKENHIKSLTEQLLKMKDWAAVLGEDMTDDGNLDLEMKSEAENGAHLDDQPKGALKKLIYAAKLNASLEALEEERNQIYTQLSEVDKTKEDLTEHIKALQTKQASLQSENAELESENQKLHQKLKVMTELYQENEMKLHRKLTVEENYRLDKEEKLSKTDEKINCAAEELKTYRKRAKDLEEELERTIQSYQGQIISHEKKAHDNWLAARTAERTLTDLRKENAYHRQKLTETEFKFELLEKDPYALDVPNTAFGREHSPYGPSPFGRPSSETRAFLSPPTLLEGPLRLSPLLPGGGGRGSRGPENPLDHHISNERGDSSNEKLTDVHREPSDTGSLSPTWEQDRRMMFPPSGQPYPDPVVPLQRQDRFYSNSGRLSGPAELQSFNMPSLDKVDGPVSSEMESGRNDTRDDLGNSNVPDSTLPAESEAAGSGFVPPPPPPVRGPLFPMDPRSHFIRRGPPFPPPPLASMYGAPRDYFLPRDFPGPPHPSFPMRTVYSPTAVPQYPPPRAGYFPPPLHSESRSEFPSGLIPPSKETAVEPSEPQEV
ncbi:melanoma inhibitory activity protein 2 isoform X6 [Castor canadensis]